MHFIWKQCDIHYLYVWKNLNYYSVVLSLNFLNTGLLDLGRKWVRFAPNLRLFQIRFKYILSLPSLLTFLRQGVGLGTHIGHIGTKYIHNLSLKSQILSFCANLVKFGPYLATWCLYSIAWSLFWFTSVFKQWVTEVAAFSSQYEKEE